MKGYVTRKGDRWYAVIHEGLDPITGRERRRWHAAGASRTDAERLAARLAKQRNGRNDQARSLTFGAYVTRRWLPGKKVNLATSTFDSYRRKVDRHILPTLGRVRSAASDPNSSTCSTRGCSDPPTVADRSHPRPCSRCTSSSEVGSPTP
jgi:hypothetical protein